MTFADLMAREREAAHASMLCDFALHGVTLVPCAEEEADLTGFDGEPLKLVSLPEPEEADRG